MLQLLYISGWAALFAVSLRTHRRPFPLFSIAAFVQCAQSILMLTGDPTDHTWVSNVWWPSRVVLCLALCAACIETCHVITGRLPLGKRTAARAVATGVSVTLLVGLGKWPDITTYFRSGIWIAMAASIAVVAVFCWSQIRPKPFWWNAGLLFSVLSAHVIISLMPTTAWYAAQAAFRLTCFACCCAWLYLSLHRSRLESCAKYAISAHPRYSATSTRLF
jgi:hypothetical protein